MSDDDRDIDIESDEGAEDLDSRQPWQSGIQYLSQSEKQAHHSALEKKRRDCIKNSFTNLRESVPALQEEKVVSRALILKKATDYIQYMWRKNSAHQQGIDDLKQQNSLLESQIQMLEKSNATGNYEYAAESSEVSLDSPKSDSESSYPHESESDTSDSEISHAAHCPKRLKVTGL
jgi:Max protein